MPGPDGPRHVRCSEGFDSVARLQIRLLGRILGQLSPHRRLEPLLRLPTLLAAALLILVTVQEIGMGAPAPSAGTEIGWMPGSSTQDSRGGKAPR